MNNVNPKISKTIKRMGHPNRMTTEQLIAVSRELFENVRLCGCETRSVGFENDCIDHKCQHQFDLEHVPTCSCCQTEVLVNCLAKAMEKLADEDRLPEFNENCLSENKIRSRSYEHKKLNSWELSFKIDRHLNAWKDYGRMEVLIQTWIFNFKELTLKEKEYTPTPRSRSRSRPI